MRLEGVVLCFGPHNQRLRPEFQTYHYHKGLRATLCLTALLLCLLVVAMIDRMASLKKNISGGWKHEQATKTAKPAT